MSIGNFALQNSVSINTLRVSLALLGIFMLFSLPREQYPNVSLYYVHVTVVYPGATVYEIEKDVTQKIEDELQGISDVENIISTISNGLNFTRLEFSQSLSDEEFQNRYQEVQSLVSNITDLPEQAQDPEVDNFTYLDFLPIVNVVVSGDVSINELIKYSERVQDTLKKTPGILKIENKGLFEKHVLVEPDIVTMRARGIAVQEIEDAIRTWNISLPGGVLHSENQSYTIRMSSDIATTEDVGNIVLRTGENTFTTISDVAKVLEDYDMTEQRVRFNGNPAVEFMLYKTGTADSITMVEKSKKRVAEILKKFERENANIHVSFFSDTTENISNTIRILVSNAILGFLLLLMSLFIFLGWRSAIISALEIPFTFATSFFVLKFLGITLNSSTLFALVLVLGMLVDHSIVILENIIRLRNSPYNKDKKTAVIDGVSDVAFPVVTSTLTTIGTFLPLAFMPGFIGKFLLPVPVTITITLVISTISALVIIPIHYLEIPGRDRIKKSFVLEYCQNVLQHMLERILRFKVLVSCIVLIIVCGVVTMLFFVPVSLYDTEDQPFFFIDVTMPTGASVERSYNIMHEMEQRILSINEDSITGVLMLIGNTDPDIVDGVQVDKPHNAQFQIEVKNPNSNNAVPIDVIMDMVRNAISTVGGANSVHFRKQRTGPPVDPAIGYQLISDDLDVLAMLDASIRKRLATYGELYNIKSSFKSKTPSFVIKIDSQKASRYNISFDYIGSTIRSLFSNDEVSSIFVDNKHTNIVVSRGNNTADAKKFLAFLTFPIEDGKVVPLAAFATIEEQRNFSSVYRKNGKRQVNISAEAHKRNRVRDIHDDISSFAENQITTLDLAVEFEIGGEFSEFSNLLNDIIRLFLISIILVYFLLTVEFKSYFQPFLIMCTVFFTTIGVSTYLFISKTSLSIAIIYSFVALVGVVVNNAIVLISTANGNVNTHHMTHHNAIISATKQRFSPIILTSFTTIVGLLPTALGLSGKSPIWQPMASTIVTGLCFSTITTLLILPGLYEIFSFDHKRKNKNQETQLKDGKKNGGDLSTFALETAIENSPTYDTRYEHSVSKNKKRHVKNFFQKFSRSNVIPQKKNVKDAQSYAAKKQSIDEVVSALINVPIVKQNAKFLLFGNKNANYDNLDSKENL